MNKKKAGEWTSNNMSFIKLKKNKCTKQFEKTIRDGCVKASSIAGNASDWKRNFKFLINLYNWILFTFITM